jgi:hypothetical protein
MKTPFIVTSSAIPGMLGIAQERISAAGVPSQMLVTVHTAQGKNVPELKREDVTAFQGKDRLRVTE